MGFASTPKGCRTEVLWLFSRVLWAMSLRASEVQVQFIVRITGSLPRYRLGNVSRRIIPNLAKLLGRVGSMEFSGF